MSNACNANAKAATRTALELLVAEFYAAGNTASSCATVASAKPKTFRSDQKTFAVRKKARG
jgi:hypothetical protein